jgi:hypothetical protein
LEVIAFTQDIGIGSTLQEGSVNPLGSELIEQDKENEDTPTNKESGDDASSPLLLIGFWLLAQLSHTWSVIPRQPYVPQMY